jgi:signal peptidase II
MVSATEQRRFAGVVLVVLILDLATKLAAEVFLRRFVGVSIIGELFQLRLVYNPGAAFGINVGDYSRWVFMTLSVAALFVLGGMLRTTRAGDPARLYALALICAGAAGNLVDRVRSPRGVVDFLDFTFGRYHFPTFNVADSAVTCGAVLLALALWNEGKHADASQGAPLAPPASAASAASPAAQPAPPAAS